MTMAAAWVAKARREGRPIVDVMREHGEAGCPEFDPNHPFWAGCEWVGDVVVDPETLRVLDEAGRQLDNELKQNRS